METFKSSSPTAPSTIPPPTTTQVDFAPLETEWLDDITDPYIELPFVPVTPIPEAP